MSRSPFLLALILLLSACTAPSAELSSEDPYGCQSSTLSAQERANCGPHLYEVLDEIIDGDCSYGGGAKSRSREDGGGIAFSEEGFQFVDVNGNYGSPHPQTAENTYALSTSALNETGDFQTNRLEYVFSTDGFRAVVTRSSTSGQTVEIGCLTQSTYSLLEAGN